MCHIALDVVAGTHAAGASHSNEARFATRFTRPLLLAEAGLRVGDRRSDDLPVLDSYRPDRRDAMCAVLTLRGRVLRRMGTDTGYEHNHEHGDDKPRRAYNPPR